MSNLFRKEDMILRKKAFTLAEVVLGIFLLGIVIITITSVFIGGLSAAKKAGKKVTNITLAEGMLNRIMFMNYSDIPPAPSLLTFDGSTKPPTTQTVKGSIKFPPSPYPFETPGETGGTVYFYTVEVEDVTGTSQRLKRIRVTVTSEGAGSEGKTITTLESLKNQ